MDYYHHLVTSASFIVQATEFHQLLHHDRTHWTKVYATFNNTNKKRITGALFLKQLLSVPLSAISTGRLPSNIASKNLQGIHLPPAELLMVTYFLSLLAHDRLAQQPQSIQTPRLCRTVVSIPHFFMWEGKKSLEITKWIYKTWAEWVNDCSGKSLIFQLAQYQIWNFQFLQASAKTKAWLLLCLISSWLSPLQMQLLCAQWLAPSQLLLPWLGWVNTASLLQVMFCAVGFWQQSVFKSLVRV